MSIQELNEKIFDFIIDTHESAEQCGIIPTPCLTWSAIHAALDDDMVILDQM